MGLNPGALGRDDVQLTIRRPSRGIAPNVVAMATERGTTSVTEIGRLANRLSGRDDPSCWRTPMPSRRGRGALRARPQPSCGPFGCRSAWARRWTSWTRRAGRPTDRPTPTTWSPSRPWRPSIPRPASFEAWLRDLLAQPPADGPGVLLSTIHKIKGREWEHVIVYGASQGLLPHRLSDDEEGERRVFHVALTRAIRQVVVLADADAPSPFVAELDGSRPHQPIAASTAGARRSQREVTGAGSHAWS